MQFIDMVRICAGGLLVCACAATAQSKTCPAAEPHYADLAPDVRPAAAAAYHAACRAAADAQASQKKRAAQGSSDSGFHLDEAGVDALVPYRISHERENIAGYRAWLQSVCPADWDRFRMELQRYPKPAAQLAYLSVLQAGVYENYQNKVFPPCQ